jgi:hypothetical protein
LIFQCLIFEQAEAMTSFLITCCHATCAIPEAQRELFAGQEELVTSPEGWEPGALNLAQGLAMKLSTPLVHGEVTRLILDIEKTGEEQFSEFSMKIPEPTRTRLADRLNEKFRHAIDVKLEEDLKRHDTIIHIDVHTAPLEDGKVLFEYTGDPAAERLTYSAAKLMKEPEISLSCRRMKEISPMLQSMLDREMSAKIGILRVTVAQSFFLTSKPLRWDMTKKSVITAISNADISPASELPTNLQFDF